MKLEIVGHADAAPANASRFADVPAEHAIRGFYGVTLLEHEAEGTGNFLNILGFHKVAEEGNRQRYSADGNALGNHIDLVIDPKAATVAPAQAASITSPFVRKMTPIS